MMSGKANCVQFCAKFRYSGRTLAVGDPQITRRTWCDVLSRIIKLKHDATQQRWITAARDHAFDLIRDLPVFETQSEHFLRVLERGRVATNVFLRRMHNFALDMGWLPWPVLPKKQWPKVEYGPKRAITEDEHQRIVAREQNPERRVYYELCWHLGGSQGDIANLNAQDIDWNGTPSGTTSASPAKMCPSLFSSSAIFIAIFVAPVEEQES